MTHEEAARFALALSEAERIRARIAEDESTPPTAADVELPFLSAAPSVEQPSISAAA